MRDLFLLAALLSVFPLILRAPQIGILAWIWVTLMNPQREVYGFLSSFQLNLYIAVLTAIAWLSSRERKTVPLNAVMVLILVFAVWTSITTYFALDYNFSYGIWNLTIKTLILALAIISITTTKARIQAVIWMLVLSLGYYGVKGGGFMLATGGSHHVFGPESTMIEDNNNLGLALVMILPFMNYLRITSQLRWVRLGLLAMIGLTIVAVIGTYSRGALFALAVMGLAFAARSRSSFIPLVLGGLVLVSLPSLVPSSWFDRMSTIRTANSDESFEGRVMAWKTSFNIAKERTTGGGFSSVNLDWVSQAYHTAGSSIEGRAAHSIYFEVLGDHGFVGLALFLMLIAAAWFNTFAILKATRDRPDLDWANKLGRMMQVSLIGYLVGGAALSMAYYDGFLIVLAMTGAVLLYVRRPIGEAAKDVALPVWRRSTEQDMRALANMPGTAMDLRRQGG